MFAFGILQIQLQNPLDNKLNFTVKLLSTYFAVVDQFATLNMSCLLTSPLSLTWQRKWGSPQRWHDALGANSILAHHQLWWCMESWYLLSWDSSWWAWSRSGVILPSSLFETFCSSSVSSFKRMLSSFCLESFAIYMCWCSFGNKRKLSSVHNATIFITSTITNSQQSGACAARPNPSTPYLRASQIRGYN